MRWKKTRRGWGTDLKDERVKVESQIRMTEKLRGERDGRKRGFN